MVQAGPISLGPAFWIARHHDTAVLECSTCCIRQNRAALFAQRNSVGTTWKSERLSSNIILHPITGRVSIPGISELLHGSPLSYLACASSGSSLWLPTGGIGVSPRCPRRKRHHLHPCKLLFAVTPFLLLYNQHPFGRAHPLSFTLWFFW